MGSEAETIAQEKALRACAARIVEKRLALPATFLLEAHKPLAGLIYNFAALSEPVLGALFGFARVRECAALFESSAHIERLVSLIEELEGARAPGLREC